LLFLFSAIYLDNDTDNDRLKILKSTFFFKQWGNDYKQWRKYKQARYLPAI